MQISEMRVVFIAQAHPQIVEIAVFAVVLMGCSGCSNQIGAAAQ